MESEKENNLEDLFFNHLCETKELVKLFLVNGVRLEGVITSFDKRSVLLCRENHSQLVYKHALATIMPVIQ